VEELDLKREASHLKTTLLYRLTLIAKVIKEGTDIPIPKQPGSAAEKISIKELEFKNPETGQMEKVQLKIDETKDNPIIPINPMIDEGPQDPGKRTFLKGVGAVGLGAVALGTGLLKLGKTLKTKTALKVLANPAVGQAEWFAPLVDKILLKGIRLEKDGKKLNTHVLKENNKTLTLTETDTSINIKVEGGGAYDDPFDVDYLKPGEHLGSAGRYQIEKPTFQISESRPQYYSSGPEDIELELSEHVATGSKFSKKPVEELLELRKGHSGILSDVEGLEKIAMGKVKDSKLAKKRGEVRDKLNKNPTEDRYTNTDQYYDDIDQVDYD
jgi:hypothetical protein